MGAPRLFLVAAAILNLGSSASSRGLQRTLTPARAGAPPTVGIAAVASRSRRACALPTEAERFAGVRRQLLVGFALLVGSPACDLVGLHALPARAEPAPIVAAAAASPSAVAEAWDFADRYFIDRTFGGHDWKAVRAQFVDGLPEDTPEEEVVRRCGEMYRLLSDKYSRALSPAEASELSKYDVTGVNVNLMRRPSDGALVVSAVPPKGSASERAGVRYGDRLLAVNGLPMAGKTPFEALESMQSDAASVRLDLDREAPGPPEPAAPAAQLSAQPSAAQPALAGAQPRAGEAVSVAADGRSGSRFSVTLPRSFSASSPVSSRVVHVGGRGRGLDVGYVRLQEFNSVGKTQVGSALTAMRERGVDG